MDFIPDFNFSPPPPDSSPPPPEEELSPPPPLDPSPPPPEEELSPPPPADSSPPPADPSPSPPPPEENVKSPSPPPPKETSPAEPSPVTEPTTQASPPPPTWSAPVANHSRPLPSNTSTTPTLAGSSRSPPPPLISSSSSSNSGIIIGVLLGGIFVIAMIIMLATCCLKKKKKNRRQCFMDPSPAPKQAEYYNNWNSKPQKEHVVKLHAQPSWGSPATGQLSNEFMIPTPSPAPSIGHNQSSFSYDQLAVATSEFSKANQLGQGGFGYVHKGVLPDGRVVAVKSLKSGSGQGEREFQAEVEIISRVHHRHLVSLVGYCILGEQRMLVYEFVPNKTLEFHLHGKGQPVMDWATRMRIALGASKGLSYLHEDCHPKIIHRDIKAANILLDNNFEAMVADFGLAKLSSDNNTHVSTRVMGTFGYLAPEYASSGKLTDKSDVFSFGVMLLELITGRKPVDASNYMEDSLVDWARPLLSKALEDGNYKGLVDPLLENNYNPDELACMVACAAASIRHSAKRRPKMTQIVRALEGDLSLDDLIDGPKPVQSSISNSIVSSSDTGLYDTCAYNADMVKFRKIVMANGAVDSSEYEATSEYGLNPSSSSSDLADSSSSHRGKI